MQKLPNCFISSKRLKGSKFPRASTVCATSLQSNNAQTAKQFLTEREQLKEIPNITMENLFRNLPNSSGIKRSQNKRKEVRRNQQKHK